MTEDEYEQDFRGRSVAFQPWLPLTSEQLEEQKVIQSVLARYCGARFGSNVYVASNANVFTSALVIGDRSVVAGGAILRGTIEIGPDCSVNAYAHLAGKITIGRGVRIAGHVSIYGFNHGTARTDIMIMEQPLTAEGVVIGDGTWIGAGAIVVDGVKVGANCVVGAGAVVIKEIPDFQIVVGNPARILRDRRDAVLAQ